MTTVDDTAAGIHDAVDRAVAGLLRARRIGGVVHVTLPMVYADGSFVTVCIEPAPGRAFRVSDGGFAFREVEDLAGARSFARSAARFAEDYARFYARTAEIIRSEIPDAHLLALSMARPGDADYTDRFLSYLAARDKLHLVDEITYHGYTYNPDDAVRHVRVLRNVVARHSDRITIRQGEQGAPSTPYAGGALGEYDWTELSQAKWALRRLLGDLGMDVPSLYFSIVDMNYTGAGGPITRMNTKGLLRANEDKTVAYRKPAYDAVQHVTAIFDHTLHRIPSYPYRVQSDSALAVFGYREESTDEQVVTIWLKGGAPRNTNEMHAMDFVFPRARFTDPVYVDVRTGTVYDIPEASWSRQGTTYTFTDLPVYDSPILIADRGLVPLQ